MATEVIMPKAGMAMETGIIVHWIKQEGDIVKKGEPLLEIMTDKVNMEIEAEVGGVLLKILAKEGEELPVFSVIGFIGEKGEIIKQDSMPFEYAGKNNENNDEISTVDKIESNINDFQISGKVRATPVARQKAREKGIDILNVRGTGPKGRIQLIDVISFDNETRNEVKMTPLAKSIAEYEGIDIEGISGTGYNGKIQKEDIKNQIITKAESLVESVIYQQDRHIIPMKGIRKIVAERMTESYFKTPAVTLNIEVNMSEVKMLRQQIMKKIIENTGLKITYTDIIAFFVTKCLMQYPIINASLTEEGILIHDYVNMAIAVGLENGLMVPVIKNIQKMGLEEIVIASKDIISRTKDNRLKPEEMEGSTFTITNLGMYGISSFTPIINQPNSAILGINVMEERVVAIDGEMEIKPMMTLSLTFDHRTVDGAPAAEFMLYLKQLLEHPVMAFL